MLRKNTFVFLVSFFFISFGIFSQRIKSNYSPIDNYHVFDSVVNEYTLNYLDPSYEHSIDYKKGVKKYNELCERHAKYFSYLAENKEIMNEDEITLFLQEILDQIVLSNPELNVLNPKVFTLRNESVNASNLGEGVILFNLGLLERLKTVDEIAFILGHELGHDYSKHVYKSIESIAVISTDKELLNKLKEAEKQEYGSNKEVSSILLKTISNRRLHSRVNEFVADSLGFRFVTNAGFGKEGALSVLEILRDSDYIRYDKEIDVKPYIHTEEYPFKKEWLETVNSGTDWEGMDSLFVLPDSLRTHPNCDVRIERINKITGFNSSQSLIRDSFQKIYSSEIQPILSFELIQLLMDKKQYSLALYYAIQLSEKYPVNLYLRSVIIDCYASIYHALKLSEFSYSVDFPHKLWPKSYNELLVFLHNMSSKKIAKIFKANYNKDLEKYKGDSYVTYLSLVDKTLFQVEINEPELLLEYKDKHGDNIYYQRLKEYIKNKSNE